MKMFNLFLSLICFMLISVSIFSQGLGVRVGVNFADQNWYNFDEETSLNIDAITSFQFGITYELNITDNLFFNPALLYSVKGSGFKIGTSEETIESKSFFKYVDVPLDLKYKLELLGIGVNIHAGSYLSYLLSVTSVINGEKEKGELDNLDRIDYGLNFGAGVEFGKLQFDLNYGLGIENIVGKDFADELSVKNKVFSITAGLRF